ncbi:hypothetical protein [Fluviispira multicolorata]|uniref:Uncharacterized protein n=1 Tax=Fluviispira multicolorata TaxID=2654512 RepID=A0A833N1L7_9BACT|nr:hypothetical protein [Fluviispira multicolorata]KAB8030935.1 hypothetical protein GCL57_08160 [Fluviispira multicolorata]
MRKKIVLLTSLFFTNFSTNIYADNAQNESVLEAQAKILYPMNTMAISNSNRVEKWNSFSSSWSDLGYMGGWPVKMMTYAESNILLAVHLDGRMGQWTGTNWEDLGFPGGWNLKMVAFDYKEAKYWSVGVDGNVGKWNGKSWYNFGNLDGWNVKMVAFDLAGTFWCVSEAGNMGRWNGKHIENLGNLGGWKMKMIAFDKLGNLWGISNQGIIGKWNGNFWDTNGPINNLALNWVFWSVK